MKTETKETAIAADVLVAFKKRVNTLSVEREQWQATQFASANDRLYQLLGEIYEIYLEAKDNTGIDQQKQEWLLSKVRERRVPLSKKPTFLQLITKYVFSESDTDSRRVNSYARVLNVAAQANVTSAGGISEFIKSYGGIEEIRSALAKNTKTPKQRAMAGAQLARTAQTIATVKSDQLAKYATTAKGTFVVLLGEMTPQGTVEIKHTVFSNNVGDEVTPSETVVAGALGNLYSNQMKAERKKAAQKRREEKEQEKSEIFSSKPSDESAPSQDSSLAA